MRFERVARKLYCEPLLIHPPVHAVLSDVFRDHVTRRAEALGIDDLFDEPDELCVEMRGPVAVIPMKGVMSREISSMEKISGGVDVEDVGELLNLALADPDVQAIVMNIDSPGGSVEGTEDLAERVRTASKPVFAAVHGMACSAAYWVASQCDAIYASPSATVGSIGVYLPILDQSRAYEMDGLRVDLVKSSQTPLKAAGFPGTSLTDAQRADFQSSVDAVYARFVAAVRGKRRMVADEAIKGGTFFGFQAQDVGLVDSVRTDALEAAVKDAPQWARRKTRG